MLPIRAAVLDFDGLILETEGSCYASWRTLFREHGADYRLDEYQRILGSVESAHALFEQRCGLPNDWTTLEERRREIEDVLNQKLEVQPGIIALLDQARALGLRLGVASSSRHRWVDRHLTTHGLFDRFDTIVCREDVAQAKPAPDLYLEAVRRLDVSGPEAVAFEDSHIGSLAAKRAGLWCIAVPTTMTGVHDFSHVDETLPTLAGLDLEALLAALAARRDPSPAG